MKSIFRSTAVLSLAALLLLTNCSRVKESQDSQETTTKAPTASASTATTDSAATPQENAQPPSAQTPPAKDTAAAEQFFAKKDQGLPNIVVIMGDDIGWFNVGAYHRGIMAGRTPHMDQIAKEGAIFTDYYAEASCTAGRANFITGQLPIRTGLTTVGQAGADLGMPAAAPTIATSLKDYGYATGQFGKNHLGDKNKFLPCVHGFDEFFGFLYHLDAMQDPFNRTYPQGLKDKVGPRNVLHCTASTIDDPSEQPRWGKIGKQKIVDKGPLPPHPMDGIEYNMETFDEVVRDKSLAFIEKAHQAGKPFFAWVNPTRMHVYTHLSPKYLATITPESNYSIQEAGMTQFDDVIGAIDKKLTDLGIDKNTIFIVTTDNGAEVFTWPDGGQTPFAGSKGMVLEGGFRVPMIARWPGRIPAGTVQNGMMSGLDWFPTILAALGNDQIVEELKQGKTLNGKEYKVHLDGYNQLKMLTQAGESARKEIWYFAESTLGAARLGDFKFYFLTQPGGWFGPKAKLDWPGINNLRLDPFERCLNYANCPPAMMEFFGHEFWRFVFVQEQVAKLAKTAVEFPPMQRGASFNLDAVKSKIEKGLASRSGQ